MGLLAMRQLTQSMRTGELKLEEVPVPAAAPGQLVIRTSRTLISQGTEKMLVDFANASLLEKARQQPERVVQVLEKMDHLTETEKKKSLAELLIFGKSATSGLSIVD